MKKFALVFAVIGSLFSLNLYAGTSQIGIVLMHGKGGAPTKFVADLAALLERDGFFVANLEMPWSGRRQYDTDVQGAENEVVSAIELMQKKGARKIFVAGHSQGGLFALYFGNKHRVDGIIAIAPGGNVANPTFREKLGESLSLAAKLVADGKGQEKVQLNDYEGSKGSYPIVTTSAAYLTWFTPDGAMNQTLTMQHINPDTPVLFITPTNDYPGLLKVKDTMFGLLPKHPLTKLYEPNSSHLNAPTASHAGIKQWVEEAAEF